MIAGVAGFIVFLVSVVLLMMAFASVVRFFYPSTERKVSRLQIFLDDFVTASVLGVLLIIAGFLL